MVSNTQSASHSSAAAEPPLDVPGLRWWRGSLFLVALALLASMPAFGDWCVLSPDSFAYLQTARTIRETGHLPQAAMMRPPGFPIVLSGLLTFGEIPFFAVRLLNMLCLCGTVLLTRRLLRHALGDRASWFAAALVATSPALLRQQIVLLSEPLFTVLSLGCLVLLEKWWNSRQAGWTDVVLAGVLTSAACLCRSTGIVLLPLSLVVLARVIRHSPRRAGPRALVYCVLAFAPIVAYQLHQRAYPTTHSYSQMWLHARSAEHTDATGLALQAQRLGRFGPHRLADLTEAVVPLALGWRMFVPPLATPTAWLVGGLLVVAAGFRLLRYLTVIDAYLLLTLAMLSLWPWDEGVRLVSPLTPLIMGYVAWIAAACWRSALLRRSNVRLGLLASLIALACLVQVAELAISQSRLRDRSAKERGRYGEIRLLAEWIEKHDQAGQQWTGITKDGSPTKVLLLGGAFLSRTQVSTIDIGPEASYDLASTGDKPVISQEGSVPMPPHECVSIPMTYYESLVAWGFPSSDPSHSD